MYKIILERQKFWNIAPQSRNIIFLVNLYIIPIHSSYTKKNNIIILYHLVNE